MVEKGSEGSKIQGDNGPLLLRRLFGSGGGGRGIGKGRQAGRSAFEYISSACTTET